MYSSSFIKFLQKPNFMDDILCKNLIKDIESCPHFIKMYMNYNIIYIILSKYDTNISQVINYWHYYYILDFNKGNINKASSWSLFRQEIEKIILMGRREYTNMLLDIDKIYFERGISLFNVIENLIKKANYSTYEISKLINKWNELELKFKEIVHLY